MSASAWTRVSGAMGIPFVVAFVVGLVLSGNAPDDTSSDQTIMDYYASHSHRVRDITTFFVLAVGLVFLVWFISHLHGLLRSAGGDGDRAANIAAVSGGLFAGVLAISGSISFAFSVVISDAGDKFTLDLSTFRLLSVVGFLTYIAAFMLGSGLAFAVGLVAWRTGVLPRWLAVVGVLGGLGAFLSAVFFFPSLVYVAWILVLSVYLAVRPAGEQERAA
jgi:hypothetical protein